jgi:uncharacterized membrane protein YfcA
MTEYMPYLLLNVGVFAGALVSGFAGFAFSAVAGAILLHVLPPTEAVPLMMGCSTVVQAVSLVSLRRSMAWRGSSALILGGALGVPPALYLLYHVDGWTFRVGFGGFLVIYSLYMLFRPAAARLANIRSRLPGAMDGVVGFAGGLVGGLTAMPGALPTIWCDLHGMSKDQQRGLVQPFIATMQCIALTLLVARSSFSAKSAIDLLLVLPALAAGTALGIAMFGRVNEGAFRRVTLAILLVAGLALVF